MAKKTQEKPRYGSNSAKQLAYRARKKREKFMSNDICVTQMLDEAKKQGANFIDLTNLVEYCYDEGGERLAQLIALKVYGFLNLTGALLEAKS